jgi:hypothetical protein
MGKKLLELLIELASQRLVVDQHERRLLDTLDEIGHREGLARPCDSEEDLMFLSGMHPGRQPCNRLRLIPTGLERSF